MAGRADTGSDPAAGVEKPAAAHSASTDYAASTDDATAEGMHRFNYAHVHQFAARGGRPHRMSVKRREDIIFARTVAGQIF